MNDTALGANKENKEITQTQILFSSISHEVFYEEALKDCRYQDVYHKALCYCLGISSDTRNNATSLYDFKTGCIKPKGLHMGWQTSGSMKITRLAFNLYTDTTVSVSKYENPDDQISECQEYSVSDIFCSGYSKYFWQVIQLRYPEYTGGI